MRAPFRVLLYRNKSRPHLKYQVVGKRNNKRVRKFCTTLAEAKTRAHLYNTEAVRHGTEAAISPELREDARECQKKLADFGKTIVEATECYLRILKERARSCEIHQLFAEFVDAKREQNCSGVHLGQIKSVGRRLAEFAEKLGIELASDFTAANIREFLATLPGKSPHTYNNNRLVLTTAFRYAEEQGYLTENVVKKIKPKRVPDKSVECYTPVEVAKLIAAASPNDILGILIQFFAGFRESEIKRIYWSDIHRWEKPQHDQLGSYFGVINLPGEKAKKGRRRPVRIRANLAAWLRLFVKMEGRVVTDYNRGVAKTCKRAGIVRKKNALRHSYGTFHAAHFGDATQLMFDMGHRSLSTTSKHYLNLGFSNEEAADYWSIAPFSRPETSNILAFKPESHWWFRKVDSIAQGEWIEGVENLARYFGVSHGNPHHWFKMPGAPPRPEDDRFHIRTWRTFVEKRLHPKTIAAALYYVVWRSQADSLSEERKYFPTEAEAAKWANECNSQLLAKELRLDELANVIEFSTGPQSAERQRSHQLTSA
jgi:site-specific recombinase XerD